MLLTVMLHSMLEKNGPSENNEHNTTDNKALFLEVQICKCKINLNKKVVGSVGLRVVWSQHINKTNS